MRRVVADFPASARDMLLQGCVRTAVYQDTAYTDRYLDRVARLVPLDPEDAAGLVTEAARHTALWMTYQDTIHVAHQKIRRRRLAGVRAEAGARDDDQLTGGIKEYLHPQVEEITDTLPTALGRRLERSRPSRPSSARPPGTASWSTRPGSSATRCCGPWPASRPVRPRSLRFGREQQAVDGWLDRAVRLGTTDPELAREVVECQRVLKGYGATHEHGRESFALLMAAVDGFGDRTTDPRSCVGCAPPRWPTRTRASAARGAGPGGRRRRAVGGVTPGLTAPVTAGVVSALVGFTSSFVVLLTGLATVGADPAQAASGLLALSVAMGVACVVLSVTTRMPIAAAWSTPGAALLVTTGGVAGGWPAAVGAFLVTGLLVVLTGLLPQLGALVARIPASVAQAMLAGVLLQICLQTVTGLQQSPWAVGPIVAVWVLGLRFASRWAVPLAFLTAVVVTVVAADGVAGPLAPRLELTAPVFTWQALTGIALPLYLVTMASQNVAGAAVLAEAGLGCRVPWRRAMLVTGAATVVAAPAGGHAVNLAAISAALTAGPEAGEDRSRRWVASSTAGVVLVVLGLGSAAAVALVGLAPAGVVAAVAGLALLTTLAAAAQAALADPADRVPAVVTLVTAASGAAFLGISSAFWALVAGLAVRAVLGSHRRSERR